MNDWLVARSANHSRATRFIHKSALLECQTICLSVIFKLSYVLFSTQWVVGMTHLWVPQIFSITFRVGGCFVSVSFVSVGPRIASVQKCFAEEVAPYTLQTGTRAMQQQQTRSVNFFLALSNVQLQFYSIYLTKNFSLIFLINMAKRMQISWITLLIANMWFK